MNKKILDLLITIHDITITKNSDKIALLSNIIYEDVLVTKTINNIVKDVTFDEFFNDENTLHDVLALDSDYELVMYTQINLNKITMGNARIIPIVVDDALILDGLYLSVDVYKTAYYRDSLLEISGILLSDTKKVEKLSKLDTFEYGIIDYLPYKQMLNKVSKTEPKNITFLETSNEVDNSIETRTIVDLGSLDSEDIILLVDGILMTDNILSVITSLTLELDRLTSIRLSVNSLLDKKVIDSLKKDVEDASKEVKVLEEGIIMIDNPMYEIIHDAPKKIQYVKPPYAVA